MAELAATIADLRKCINVLPKIDTTRRDIDLMEQHRRHRAAAQRLGQYLSETYDAKITERTDINRITMHRISSTSTGGLIGAYSNWIAAAEKRLGAEQKERP